MNCILRSILNRPYVPRVTDKREALKSQAIRAATARNHRLGPWTDFDNYRACAKCEVCGKEAYIDGRPAPNGIDVSGEAVALNCSRDELRRIKITYDTVTEESAAEGDFADNGWYDEEGVIIDPDDFDVEEAGSELAAVVESAVKTISGNGGVEPSCFPGWCARTWYTTVDADKDYEAGEDTYYNYHLEGFSEEEERAIYTALVVGR